MSTGPLEAQVAELQARIAYQEDTLRALDTVVAEQAVRLARLEERLALLLDRLEGALAPDAGDAGDERPPHY